MLATYTPLTYTIYMQGERHGAHFTLSKRGGCFKCEPGAPLPYGPTCPPPLPTLWSHILAK